MSDINLNKVIGANTKFISERLSELRQISTSATSDTLDSNIIEEINKCKGSIEANRLEESCSAAPWLFLPEQNEVRHIEGRYFSVQLFNVHSNALREEKNWIQPLIVENNQPAGVLAQFLSVRSGSLYWLVQLKSEPGDVAGYNLTTTIQATYENIFAPKHIEKMSQLSVFLQAFSDNRVLFSLPIQEDGGRYFRKVNQLIAVEVDYDTELQRNNFLWIKHETIRSLFKSPMVPISAQLRFMMCQFLV
jgi:hypothetical protein